MDVEPQVFVELRVYPEGCFVRGRVEGERTAHFVGAMESREEAIQEVTAWAAGNAAAGSPVGQG